MSGVRQSRAASGGIAALVCATAALAGATSASAASTLSLAVSPTSHPKVNDSLNVAETGTSVGSGTVNIYAQTGDADCAATAGDEDRRPTSDLVDTHDLEFAAPTDFSFANHFTVDTPGSWRICGYVFQDEPGIDASPEALVTLSLRVKSLPLAPCKPGTHRVNSVCVKKKKKRKSTRK